MTTKPNSSISRPSLEVHVTWVGVFCELVATFCQVVVVALFEREENLAKKLVGQLHDLVTRALSFHYLIPAPSEGRDSGPAPAAVSGPAPAVRMPETQQQFTQFLERL